ncbi:DUF1127 domain-containing protein [Pseudomonas sp. SDO528_S397]
MNGLSDVRRGLRHQERTAEPGRGRYALCGLSRWRLFWLRRHTRKALLDMTPEQLRDIGLSAEQALREGMKPFWRG